MHEKYALAFRFALLREQSSVARVSIVTSLLVRITARLCHRQSGARKALQLPRSLLASHTHNIHLSIGIRHKRLQASAQAKPEKVLNISFCRVSSKIQVKRNISCYREVEFFCPISKTSSHRTAASQIRRAP